MSSALDLCALAWGSHDGFVALSVRDPALGKEDVGYWVDHMFGWPNDRAKVAKVLDQAKDSHKDIYWAPAVFAKRSRRGEAVNTVDTLWADLDESNPASLPKHLKPTAAWESSPGRYQALWTLTHELPATAQSELNQRLTYAIGADKGGWDLGQVLRIPGTRNHKYATRPEVKLLYINGHKLDPVALSEDLPEISGPRLVGQNLPDPLLLLRRYKHKLKARAHELIKARRAEQGTRSDRLWELECLLAEAGMQQNEIVAVVQATVWNKFEGRNNEIDQLTKEAAKALVHVGTPHTTVADGEVLTVEDDVQPSTWQEFDKDHQPIVWMVAEIWGESEVGFISGLPKSYKSWLSLDLAVSVATGTRFLNAFQTRQHNVLLIQEEDPKPILQDRLVKVAGAKGLVWAKQTEPTKFQMQYDLPENLYIISNEGFSINDEWMDMLEGWINERDIKLVILDPLMMIAGGGFDEFKAFEFMQEVLKPLKRVRARTGAAIVLVHHHIKGSADAGAKSMYGSVALWAWEEAALHLQVTGPLQVTAERFSKHSLLKPLVIDIPDVTDGWKPTISQAKPSESLADLFSTYENGATVEELVVSTQMGRDAITRQLRAMETSGTIYKAEKRSSGKGRSSQVWRLKREES